MRALAYGVLVVFVAVVLSTLVLAVLDVTAHPGRLDAEGCHTVRQDYSYADGRVVKAGERHCHRILDRSGMPLDGHEVLQDERHDHRDLHERCKDDALRHDCAEFWGPH